MKNFYFFKRWLVLCGLMMVWGTASADTYTSRANGNWNATNVWQVNGTNVTTYPTANDDVVINNTITLNVTTACKSLKIIGGTFQQNDNMELTINGDFWITGGTWNVAGNSKGNIYLNGNFIYDGGTLTIANSGSTDTKSTLYMRKAGTSIKGNSTNDVKLFNLAIDVADDPNGVVVLEKNLFFRENGSNETARLYLKRGILKATGKWIRFAKYGEIIATSPSNFASPLICGFDEGDAPTIIHMGESGSALKVTGTISILNFNKFGTTTYGTNNLKFPNNSKTAATVYVWGTLYTQGGQTEMDLGTFIWGPNSWYQQTNSFNTASKAPDGTKAATGGTTKTSNTSYVVPEAIQDAIDACSSCDVVDQNLDVYAQSASVCSGTGTNIVVDDAETGVLYALYAGSTKIGTDVAGAGGTALLPTGNLTATTTFTVKTSENNLTACPNKKIGSDVQVTIKAATAINTQPQSVEIAQNGGGGTTTLTVAATGSNLHYQWYKDSQTVGADQNSLSVSTATIGTASYYVVVTGDCPTSPLTSNTVTVKVKDPTTIDPDAGKSCTATTMPTNYLYKTATAPTVDGSKDAVYSNSKTYSINNRTTGTALAGYSANWQVLYDANRAYFFVTVNANAITPTSLNMNGHSWDSDCIELRIYTGSAYKEWRIWSDNTCAVANGASNTGMNIVYSLGTGSYTAEFSIPWTSLGITPTDMTTAYMDLGVNLSNQSGGGRQVQYATFSTSDQWYQNYGTSYGLMTLYSGTPDLAITDADVVQNGNNLAINSITVSNLGSAAIPIGTTIKLKFALTVDGETYYRTYTTPQLTSAIAAGATGVQLTGLGLSYSNLPCGIHTLDATVNSNFAIAEGNCTNNVLSDDYTVTYTPILDTFTVKWTPGERVIDCSGVGTIEVPEVLTTGNVKQLETYFTLASGYSDYTVWLGTTKLGQELDKSVPRRASTYYDYGNFPFNGTVYVRDAGNNVVETYSLNIVGSSSVGTGTGETPADVVQTEYFTLTGIKLAKRPASGIVIVKEILRNGDVNVKKAIIQ